MLLEVTLVKILGSTIAMANKHSLEIAETRQESLRVWKDAKPPVQASSSLAASAGVSGDKLTISDQARQAYKAGPSKALETLISVDSEFFGLSPEDRLLIIMLEKVLGIKIKLPEGTQVASKAKAQPIYSLQLQLAPQASQSPARAGWGFSYDLTESYKESESMSFAARGIVRTADGKEISIELQLNMSRQFVSQRSLSIRAGDAKVVDPLVINYSGPAADFTKTTFRFDIDTDGSGEDVPFLAAGSGFLTLDRNGDGAVNSGAELFGPSTGNGFGELKQFDSDRNGWIDSGDPIFGSLRIWTRDDQGNDVLFGLAEKGVGAIYLGSMGASYSVKDDANLLQAQNTRMGLYVSEGGGAGTVQQVDLAIGKR